jgi:hypothetical protein
MSRGLKMEGQTYTIYQRTPALAQRGGISQTAPPVAATSKPQRKQNYRQARLPTGVLCRLCDRSKLQVQGSMFFGFQSRPTIYIDSLISFLFAVSAECLHRRSATQEARAAENYHC